MNHKYQSSPLEVALLEAATITNATTAIKQGCTVINALTSEQEAQWATALSAFNADPERILNVSIAPFAFDRSTFCNGEWFIGWGREFEMTFSLLGLPFNGHHTACRACAAALQASPSPDEFTSDAKCDAALALDEPYVIPSGIFELARQAYTTGYGLRVFHIGNQRNSPHSDYVFHGFYNVGMMPDFYDVILTPSDNMSTVDDRIAGSFDRATRAVDKGRVFQAWVLDSENYEAHLYIAAKFLGDLRLRAQLILIEMPKLTPDLMRNPEMRDKAWSLLRRALDLAVRLRRVGVHATVVHEPGRRYPPGS